jgi:hypothetical protein
MTRNHRHLAIGALAVAATLTVAACGSASGAPGRAAGPANTTNASASSTSSDRIDPVSFHADMRKLWEDHITWTRLYLVSAIAGLPDLDATAGRPMQNQDDIGNAIAPFYGRDAGNKLSALLREHIQIAGELVAAAKSGDNKAVTAQHDRWYRNADDIAAFLAHANPAWPESTLRVMMRVHLTQTLAEATDRLKGDWTADIAAYDRIHRHILAMADALADGIVEQFPQRFAT